MRFGLVAVAAVALALGGLGCFGPIDGAGAGSGPTVTLPPGGGSGGAGGGGAGAGPGNTEKPPPTVPPGVNPGPGVPPGAVATTFITAFAQVSDIAIDPASGNLFVLGFDEVTWSTGLALIERGTGLVLNTVNRPVDGWNISAAGAGLALVTSGQGDAFLVNMLTGETGPVEGFESLALATPAFVDAGGDLGDGSPGSAISVECEPSPGSVIEIYSTTDGSAYAVTASVPLPDETPWLWGVAFAPDRNTLITDAGGGFLVEYDLTTGAASAPLSIPSGNGGMAYDSVTGHLLTLSTQNGGTVVAEFEL